MPRCVRWASLAAGLRPPARARRGAPPPPLPLLSLGVAECSRARRGQIRRGCLGQDNLRSKERITMRTSLWLGVVAVAFGAGTAAAQTPVLTNATLIDGSGAPPRPNVTIMIERGRIADIMPTPQGQHVMEVPRGATVVDLTGKFVVPGIINGHGHV